MAHLIDKSAVVAEIERRLCLLVPKMTFHRQRVELEKLLSFLDTLEVKNVEDSKNQEWSADDERNLNVVLSFIDDEYLRKWLKDVVHERYD